MKVVDENKTTITSTFERRSMWDNPRYFAHAPGLQKHPVYSEKQGKNYTVSILSKMKLNTLIFLPSLAHEEADIY